MSSIPDFDAYVADLCDALGHKNRHEPMKAYCGGLMLNLERKSVEPMAAALDADNVRSRHQSMHHFVSTSPWSDRRLLDTINRKVFDAMGEKTQRYWLIDDTGHPKKGRHSVGVSHQYCGQLGKQSNCQVAVSLSVATEQASVPIDYRLYLPKRWAEDKDRRAGVGVPEDIEFRTKHAIALDQVRAALQRGVECGPVLADAGYGNDTDFRESLERMGLEYVVGINPTTKLWAPGVEPLPPKPWSGRGRKPKNMRLAEGHEPIGAEQLAIELDARCYRTITWRQGTNEPLCSRFARVRVRAAHEDHLRAECRAEQWLLIEWPAGEQAPTKYFLATLPKRMQLQHMVGIAKMRWRIERDYQELKQEFGLNQYEGRSWRGFHHHATLCIAGYAFLTIDRLRHPARKKKPRPSAPPALPGGFAPRGSPAHAAAR